MHHDPRAAEAMHRGMDAERRALDLAFALERRARFVEHDHVARPRFRPMQPERQDQVAVFVAGDSAGEVIVDALFELVQHGEAMCGGELDLRLPHRIGRWAFQRMN
jgi:hypothetical protein